MECAFGILQARFSIVRGSARFWDEATLNNIMKACIILYNMIIEDKWDPNGVQQGDDYKQVPESIPTTVSQEPTTKVQNFIQSHIRIKDRETHSQLQDDLVEHLWQLFGQSLDYLILIFMLALFIYVTLYCNLKFIKSILIL